MDIFDHYRSLNSFEVRAIVNIQSVDSDLEVDLRTHATEQFVYFAKSTSN